MNNLLISLHNLLHNTATSIGNWAQANPYKALLLFVFFVGIIVGALLF
jgi:hypothetical protein